MAENKSKSKYRYANNYGAPVYGQLALKNVPRRDTKPDAKPSIGIYTAPLRIEDTFTGREIRAVRAGRASQAVSIVMAFVIVLLGITAVIRFSSIFEISKQTGLLEKNTAKAAETLSTQQALFNGELLSADAVSAAGELDFKSLKSIKLSGYHCIRRI